MEAKEVLNQLRHIMSIELEDKLNTYEELPERLDVCGFIFLRKKDDKNKYDRVIIPGAVRRIKISGTVKL